MFESRSGHLTFSQSIFNSTFTSFLSQENRYFANASLSTSTILFKVATLNSGLNITNRFSDQENSSKTPRICESNQYQEKLNIIHFLHQLFFYLK